MKTSLLFMFLAGANFSCAVKCCIFNDFWSAGFYALISALCFLLSVARYNESRSENK
jgi:hypothetical protein